MLVDVAREFRQHVDQLLEARRQTGTRAPDDVITDLMQTRVNGVPLTDDDITSILRNWTVGELGSIAAGVGIVTQHLATDADLQARLRAGPPLLSAAIDEILRISDPLVLNRRVATRDVVLGGRRIRAGERLSLMWIAANRDEQAVDQPEEVRFDRDPRTNLLFGAGIHACPGAPLARLELRVALDELLGRSRHFELPPNAIARRACYPAGGWSLLPLRFT